MPPPPPPPLAATKSGRKRTPKVFFGDAGEQEAKRFRSEPVREKAVVPLAVEREVPAFCAVGARVKAIGLHGGSHKLFEARVLRIRERFPRLVVEFVATLPEGLSSAPALPQAGVRPRGHGRAGVSACERKTRECENA